MTLELHQEMIFLVLIIALHLSKDKLTPFAIFCKSLFCILLFSRLVSFTTSSSPFIITSIELVVITFTLGHYFSAYVMNIFYCNDKGYITGNLSNSSLLGDCANGQFHLRGKWIEKINIFSEGFLLKHRIELSEGELLGPLAAK